jgi:sugar phosphate permease
MKKALIYFLAFMGGGLIGILILGHVPDSLSFLSNGPLNFPIFGAIGFGICAIVYKEYKKLLLVPVIAFVVGLVLLVTLFWGG